MKGKLLVCALFLAVILCGCMNKKNTENKDEPKVDSITIENADGKNVFPIDGTVYVASHDGLNLRSTGNVTGTKIRLLPQNTELTVLAKSEEKETIDEIRDYWYMVDTGDEIGWVFGGYLFHKPVNEKIKNIEIAKMIAEAGDFWKNGNIMSLKGAIEYYNNDTLIIYDTTSKESHYFLTDHDNIFLINIEETPGWLYAISPDYEIQGYVYLYDISEKSFYGSLDGDGKNGGRAINWLKTEYGILKKTQNIKRYGPLLIINHKGKNIEFWDTRSGPGFSGVNYLLSDYYPESNEALIKRIWWEGWENHIYNLEHEEYRCERIETPYFNKTRTAMFSLVYLEDIGSYSLKTMKLFSISNGFYTEIFNENIDIANNWSIRGVDWLNDQKARIDFGEAGSVTLEIGQDIKMTNNLVPIKSY